MSRLKWDQVGEKTYELGVDHGVLYPMVDGAYPKGVAWNGLISVAEAPSGAEPTDYYADNIKYFSIRSAETFGATVECYTYPQEFRKCDGVVAATDGVYVGQQTRQNFGLCYRTKVGNDSEGQDAAYQLHLIYNASVSPSEKAYQTINDSPEAITFSYEMTTTPVSLSSKDDDGNELKPTATLVIDSRGVSKEKMAALEDLLYGKDGEGAAATDPKLPSPDEVITLLKAAG